MRIGFVIPWYGADLTGGAEHACRALATATARYVPAADVHVFTTALAAFSEDWNVNRHPEGESDDAGVRVHRFAATPADRTVFARVNRWRLMPPPASRAGRAPRPPLPAWLEPWYLSKMVQSPGLVARLAAERERFDWLVFIPYLYGTTVAGVRAAPERAALIPCLHDERYAYLRCYREVMGAAQALLFHTAAEQRLANRLYAIAPERQLILGATVDTEVPRGDAERFRARHGIRGPFLLYAGRRIIGKRVPELVEAVRRVRERSARLRDLTLVLIGHGDLAYPAGRHPHVRDLGFVTVEDKHDALAAALALCQPSHNESFSIVLMEAWLQGTPCLVPAACEVTREHVEESGGGIVFADDAALAAAAERLLADPAGRAAMGARGRAFVLGRYARGRVVERFVDFLARRRAARVPAAAAG